MTLDEFQKSPGIRAEEQILLLNNPAFPGPWRPVFRPFVERGRLTLPERLVHGTLRRLGLQSEAAFRQSLVPGAHDPQHGSPG
jgi:hypothetical protein